MKIIDTTTYFEEKMMMEIRFNILNDYVDYFIVSESTFTHTGRKKKINFNPSDYPKFKNKIIHLVLDKEPENIIKIDNNDYLNIRNNSINRILHQRNFIQDSLKNFNQDDYIIHSDNDEIPNLKDIDFNKNKNDIIIFKQKLFYFKFNLSLPNVSWFGSKACKIKNLKTISWLRNIKNKKYNYFRIDTLFSKNKYKNVKLVDNGGWHFSNLKTADELERKYLNDENYADYISQNYSIDKIKDDLNNKTIGYNHSAKSGSEKRFSKTKLSNINEDDLPNYLRNNKEKYREWFD
ncbi:hypothetical protein ABXT47_03940 [Candidatus Pelagibacter sp. Uisw_099_02]|uniref:hypothetical protein n=1 Tax=Candidatus Pelagibacter sp. Uisw_099_02 TaxID=3230981 RepID=UPI002375C063|nr:hypothetical protein [Candidatus Pelagibacter sp.]